MKPTISIIVLSFNTKQILKNCIESIIKNDKRLDFSGKKIDDDNEQLVPAELIVVDNGSKDGSSQYLKSLKNGKICNLKLIFNKKNLGFGKANNQAMKISRGEYILLLNSDTIIFDASISQILYWLSTHPEYDMVGSKLLNSDKTVQGSVANFPHLKTVFKMLFFDRISNKKTMYSPETIGCVDWIMGAFMLLRKDVYRQTKGFDEKFFMYMEEVEWCYRIYQQKFKIGFYPNARIIHLGGKSSPNRTGPIVSIYNGLIYFYKKHKKPYQLSILRAMLYIKATGSYLIGFFKNDDYLKQTYRQAMAVARE
jgi:GT2 family glycosyltransferase